MILLPLTLGQRKRSPPPSPLERNDGGRGILHRRTARTGPSCAKDFGCNSSSGSHQNSDDLAGCQQFHVLVRDRPMAYRA